MIMMTTSIITSHTLSITCEASSRRYINFGVIVDVLLHRREHYRTNS
jgi:hypothetical protein